MTLKICAIVPSHNHYLVIDDVVQHLCDKGLFVFVIDDGSAEPAATHIANLHNPEKGVEVTRLSPNRGKGGAVIEGFRIASQRGFTHALQVDADGQHDHTALSRLLSLSEQYPKALISGQPIYDASIPKSRKIGRWFTHVWVWVETLSFQISDSMCGYRVYPLTATLSVVDRETVGLRMDFDTEIMVRLFWRGTATVMVPVKVTYPENNTSNFDVVGDNIRITKMHTRLVFSMLGRLPSIIKNRPRLNPDARKWATLDERGIAWGLKFLATTYKLLGKRMCWIIMQPVLLYFFLSGSVQRRAQKRFWQKIYALEGRAIEPGTEQLWRHTQSFGRMALDKFSAWMGDVTLDDLVIPNEREFDDVLQQKKGVLILASHLGNIEICRALSQKRNDVKITVFAHTKHAKKFNDLLAEYNPDAALDVVEVSDMGPATAIELQERLEQGEWIVIAGDRTPVEGDKRLSHVSFLGHKAPFSQGPIIMASLLKCPLYSMICVKEENKFRVLFEKLSDQVVLPRKSRTEAIDFEVSRYAQVLEKTCKKHPLQWYNFFDFWAEEK